MATVLVFGGGCFALGWAVRAWVDAHLAGLLIGAHTRFTAWLRRRRRAPGRPRLDPALIALIRRISAENPLWGAPRIHGELLKLGFRLAQSTVSKYMPPRSGRPGPGWRAFLAAHAEAIVAVDLFTVIAVTGERLYGFVVLAHGARAILRVEAARHPTALWLARTLALALGINHPYAILVRDNDGLYGGRFRDQIRALALGDRPTRPASPWQNGHVERLIGSIRRECLDHVIVCGEGHLQRLLTDYAEYYNTCRTHLALGKDAPHGRPVDTHGRVAARPILGGLHHHYRRRS